MHSLSNKLGGGSFSFCNKCPTNKNCCTRMREGGEIDNALIFPEEAIAIENYSGINRTEFIQEGRCPKDHTFQTLKGRKNGGCYFHRAGRCEIYSVRPFDCRLFPFDIIEDEDENLRWILYTGLCPVSFNYRIAYQQLRNFFDLSEDDAWAYSMANTPGMEDNSYIELDPVYEVALSPSGDND